MVVISRYENTDRPLLQEIRSGHLSYWEKRLVCRWHFNEKLPVYSSIPSKDTCHRRIKRVTKQTVYNCINDFLAWGYVRKRGRNEMRNHRQGHLPVIHWPKLKSIVLEDPSLFIDEMK